MKIQCLLLLFLAAFSLTAVAERRDMPCERVAFGDRVLEGTFWDASAQSAVDEGGRGFASMGSRGFITEYIDADAEHYLLRGDSLLFRGYTRGRNIGALVDSVAPMLRFPLVPGDSLVSAYTVSGSVDGLPVFREEGEVCGCVLRRGRFVYASGDTVAALLVHERRTCATIADDSTATANHDEFWRWYAPGEYVPFAVQMRRSGDGSARLFTGERPEGEEAEEDDAPDDERRRRVLADAVAEVSGDAVTVTLGCLPGVEAEVYVIDVAGNIYGRASRSLDDASNEFRIELPAVRGCMLVITIGGEPPLTEKRLLDN